MEELSELERSVLDKALSGGESILAVLREQARGVRVAAREFTGVGFFTTLVVEAEAPIAERSNFELADVSAEIEGLEHGAGFVLFVRKGRIETLEGFTFDEPWPDTVGKYRLSFDREPRTVPEDTSGP